MRIAALVMTCLLVLSFPAFAQNIPRVEVSGGYAFVRDSTIDKGLHGWSGSAAVRLYRWLGIVGEVDGAYRTEQIFGTGLSMNLHTLVAGPRVSLRRWQRTTPFAHVLVGVSRAGASILAAADSAIEPAFQTGGGVDLFVSSRLGVRVGADYRRVLADEPGNQLRLVAGIVLGGTGQ